MMTTAHCIIYVIKTSIQLVGSVAGGFKENW